MKRRVGVLVAVTMLGGASTAAAGKPAAKRGGTHSEKLFAALDLNHDGQISRNELYYRFQRQIAGRVAVRFTQLDRNGDKRVTRREAVGMEPGRFERFDLNRDGAFTQVELTTVMFAQIESRLAGLLASLDADGDRSCSLAELDAHRARLAAARQERSEETGRLARHEEPARQSEKKPDVARSEQTDDAAF